MSTLVRFLIALVVGFLVYWLCVHIFPYMLAVLFGFIIGILTYLQGPKVY